MNCKHFRESLLQDPSCGDAEFLRHKEQCSSCRAEWEQVQAFERTLRSVILQPGRPVRKVGLPSIRRRLWRRTWVKAAPLVLLLLGSLGGYSLARHMFSQDNLAELVLHHVDREPGLLRETRLLDDMSVVAVFSSLGFEFRPLVEGITAAAPCWIRKGKGVHMVLRGREGAVTVLLMPGEHLDEQHQLRSGRWSGMLVPEQWGSMAVLAAAGEDTAAIARLVEQSVRWKGRPSASRF